MKNDLPDELGVIHLLLKVLIHLLLISSMIAERLGYTPNFMDLGHMESTFPGGWGSVGWMV